MTARLSGRKNHAFAELVRFGVVGVLGTGVYLLSTIFLRRYAHLSIAVAAGVSFVLVVMINYLLHYSWTFRSERSHASTLPRFMATAVTGMAINSAVLWFGARTRLLSPLALLLSGVCLVVVWNYLLSKFWVFMTGVPGRSESQLSPDTDWESGL